MIKGRFPRGAVKPPLGTQINLNHPFCKGLIMSVPLNEYGSMSRDSVIGHRIASINVFTANGSTYRLGADGGGTNAPFWGSNLGGPCIVYNNQTNAIDLGSSNGFPTDAVTLCFIRRKTDTVPLNRNLFNLGDAGADSIISIACPYGDGKVYFAFKNFTQEYVISGLTFTTELEKWIFVASVKEGFKVFRDGVKIAEDTTPITARVLSTTSTYLGISGALTTADLEEINCFHAVGIAWSDDMCRWWTAEPYAHFYVRPVRYAYYITPGLLAISVNAGPDQSVDAFNIVTLAGSGTGTSYLWSQVSGPGTAIFNDVTDPLSTVGFTVSGVYVFKLTATNILGTASDTVQITIINAAPVVVLDGDQTIIAGDITTVTATTRTDDGLPIPPGLITSDWSINGPYAPVLIGLTDTTATWRFPFAGVYIATLSVFDGEKTTTASVTIIVLADCVLPSPDPDDCDD